MEDEIENFLNENWKCYERFTFDKIIRFLLENDYSHEDAKDTILYHCSLSQIIFEERISNRYYERIEVDQSISEDLLDLKNQMFNKLFDNKN